MKITKGAESQSPHYALELSLLPVSLYLQSCLLQEGSRIPYIYSSCSHILYVVYVKGPQNLLTAHHMCEALHPTDKLSKHLSAKRKTFSSLRDVKKVLF